MASEVSEGDFHLLEKSSRNIVLRFSGYVPSGAAEAMIGQYVGREHYIVCALQKTCGRRITAAMKGLFGKFNINGSTQNELDNIFQYIDVQSLNVVLNRKQLQLYSDQVAKPGTLSIDCNSYALCVLIKNMQSKFNC